MVSEGTAMGPGFLHTHYFPHFVDCYPALWVFAYLDSHDVVHFYQASGFSHT